ALRRRCAHTSPPGAACAQRSGQRRLPPLTPPVSIRWSTSRMATKSVVLEVREITLAIELIELGARLQLLEAETSLSRDRLIKLYKELKGESPPKGMLPFSTDWFMTWQPNIHSSLFYNIYRFMSARGGCETIQSIVKGYRLYREHVQMHGEEPVLSLTRAWTLVRFFDSGMLQLTPCTRCGR